MDILKLQDNITDIVTVSGWKILQVNSHHDVIPLRSVDGSVQLEHVPFQTLLLSVTPVGPIQDGGLIATSSMLEEKLQKLDQNCELFEIPDQPERYQIVLTFR